MARSALLNVMVGSALKAGRALSRDFGEVANLQVSVKGPANFVSAADRKAETILRTELERARPGWSFLMEESGAIEGRDPHHRWVIDPLDGTTNFLHSIPHFAVSLALERDGQAVAGVIYNPATDELYVAERGGGAWLNDRRLRVGARRELSACVVGCNIPHLGRAEHMPYLERQRRVMLEVAGVRAFGAAALDLAYVAAGRLDACFLDSLSPWDLSAGILMVREAGGFTSDAKGGQAIAETGTVVAGNEMIHRALLGVIG